MVERVGGGRGAIDRVGVRVIDAAAEWLTRHWLALWNGALGSLFAGAFAAPLLAAAGLEGAADALYRFYQYLCHQLPYRSSYLAGQKICLCDRCMALYAGLLVGGLLFALVRRRLRRTSLWVFLLSCVPIGIDGFTQLFGWRESDFLLRIVTGVVFGFGLALLAYPLLDKGWRQAQAQLAVSTAEPTGR